LGRQFKLITGGKVNMKYINSTLRVISMTACLVIACYGAGMAENLVLVLNQENKQATFNKDDVRKIFIGDKLKWDDNSTIVLAVLNDGNTTHDAFIQNYVGRSPAQFTTTWKKNVFTGKGTPPKVFNDSTSLMDYISKNKNAVGYATKNSKVPGNVKAVDVN
jgi:ABC-type phosphate transport system substrate-binding protein